MPHSHAFVYVLRQETMNVSLQFRNVSTAALEGWLMKATVMLCQATDRARVLADEGQSRKNSHETVAMQQRNLEI